MFAMRAWPNCPPNTVTEARPGNYSFYLSQHESRNQDQGDGQAAFTGSPQIM